jgi:hypothetical protein
MTTKGLGSVHLLYVLVALVGVIAVVSALA